MSCVQYECCLVLFNSISLVLFNSIKNVSPFIMCYMYKNSRKKIHKLKRCCMLSIKKIVAERYKIITN